MHLDMAPSSQQHPSAKPSSNIQQLWLLTGMQTLKRGRTCADVLSADQEMLMLEEFEAWVLERNKGQRDLWCFGTYGNHELNLEKRRRSLKIL